MITISLCMIVKNEAETIERCLSSVSGLVDEIILVDTGSTDQTKQLASKFTNNIYDFVWVNDFSKARNFAFQHATMDYILWLDADDVLLPEDNERFLLLKTSLSNDVDVVRMKYNTGFDEFGNVTFSYYRERLVKRAMNFQWREPVHEYLEIYGRIITSEVEITHKKIHTGELNTRNLDIYESQLKDNKPLSARGVYYYGRELKTHGRYAEAAKQFEQFHDSKKGWVEDNITACGELSMCYAMLDQPDLSLQALFKSFSYDTPRAEICVLIGYHFKKIQNYPLAAYWFELILSLQKPKQPNGFIQHDTWDYIPLLESVVCYDRLGDLHKANHYNNLALKLKPNSKAALYNQEYFRKKLEQGG